MKKENDKELKNKLKEAEKQRDEYLEGWKRAKADFINYKKEEGERLANVVTSAEGAVIEDMIRVLDSLNLGLVSCREETPEKKGMELIRTQLEDALKKYGVEKIQIEVGEEFDPNTQECLEVLESKKPKGTIIEEVEAGYTMHKKVVRPAKVKVAK
ncbi:nucleotide exchange factor GrpE [bacterium]|nr:nucleotide exchange factor GrpE [bacterium]|tara:strand:- start:604 stop:1071 length:468 start_codon:yes stop_codon:yes gene_type:complete